MEGHWKKYVNMGIATHVLPLIEHTKDEKGILGVVEQIAGDLFFGNVEIVEVKDIKIRRQLKKVIQMSYLLTVFSAAHTIFGEELDLNSLDGSIRNKAVGRIKELIDMAFFFGARKFVLASGLDVDIPKRIDAGKALVDSLLQICQYSREQEDKAGEPMVIAMETFDREYSHKLLIGPVSEAIGIVDIVNKDHDNMGLMLDLGHLPLIGDDIGNAVSQAKRYLKHIHIGNCVLKDKSDPRFSDTHPYFGYPGGENDIEQISLFLRYLKENDYFGKNNILNVNDRPTINFEIMRKPGDDLNILIANMKRAFIIAWELAGF